jgi:squalene-hopene/tetraprenyl-beta-curcumene cyclase
MYRHYFPLIAMARARRHFGLAAKPRSQHLGSDLGMVSEALRGRACG